MYETAIKAYENRSFRKLVCVQLQFTITKTARGGKNQKGAASGRPGNFSPLGSLGFAPQNHNFPNKNGRFAPGFADLSKFGGVLQPSSNRIRAKLTPATTRASLRASAQKNLLIYFLMISPACLFGIL